MTPHVSTGLVGGRGRGKEEEEGRKGTVLKENLEVQGKEGERWRKDVWNEGEPSRL